MRPNALRPARKEREVEMNQKALLIALPLGLSLTLGCTQRSREAGTQQETTPTTQRDPTKPPQGESVVRGDPNAMGGEAGRRETYGELFAQYAASLNQFEIESSEMILDKENIPAETEQLAREIIKDHQQAGDKLRRAAQLAAVQVPEEMMDKEIQKLKELKNAPDDQKVQTYRSLQKAAHKNAIDLFKQCTKECESQELRQFAESTLPVLQSHERQLAN